MAILGEVDGGLAARLLERMSLGIDRPATARKILNNLSPPRVAEIIEKMEATCVTRILLEMETMERVRVFEALSPDASAEIFRVLMRKENGVRTARAANILKRMEPGSREGVLRLLPESIERPLREEIEKPFDETLRDTDMKSLTGGVDSAEPHCQGKRCHRGHQRESLFRLRALYGLPEAGD